MMIPLQFIFLSCCQEENKLSLHNMSVPTTFIRNISIFTVSNMIQFFNQLCQALLLIHVKCLTFSEGTVFLQKTLSLHNPG